MITAEIQTLKPIPINDRKPLYYLTIGEKNHLTIHKSFKENLQLNYKILNKNCGLI